MKDWFDTLHPREQVSVMVCGVLIVCAVLYFGLWAPLSRSNAALSESVATWERSLGELRPLIASVSAGGNRSTGIVNTGQSLVVIVDTTLGQRSLSPALQRSQPTGENGIRVEFQHLQQSFCTFTHINHA